MSASIARLHESVKQEGMNLILPDSGISLHKGRGNPDGRPERRETDFFPLSGHFWSWDILLFTSSKKSSQVRIHSCFVHPSFTRQSC